MRQLLLRCICQGGGAQAGCYWQLCQGWACIWVRPTEARCLDWCVVVSRLYWERWQGHRLGCGCWCVQDHRGGVCHWWWQGCWMD